MIEPVILKMILQVSISVYQSVPKPQLRKVKEKQHFQILSFKAPFSLKTYVSHTSKSIWKCHICKGVKFEILLSLLCKTMTNFNSYLCSLVPSCTHPLDPLPLRHARVHKTRLKHPPTVELLQVWVQTANANLHDLRKVLTFKKKKNLPVF